MVLTDLDSTDFLSKNKICIEQSSVFSIKLVIEIGFLNFCEEDCEHQRIKKEANKSW